MGGRRSGRSQFVALASGSFSELVFARDQQLSEHVQITAQNAQAEIAFKAALRSVAAALQSITCLQGSDGGFDAGMALSGLPELHARVSFLPERLPCARHGQQGCSITSASACWFSGE